MEERRISPEKMEEIWLRDEFTCGSCGKTLSWEDLHIGYVESDEGGRMVALCGECMDKNESTPLIDDEKRRVLSLLRQCFQQVIWEDVEESGEDRLDKAERKLNDLKEENRRIREQMEDRAKMVGAYKKKYEREMRDFRNFKNRTEQEIKRKVGHSTKEVALGLMEAMDNIDRALKDLNENNGGNAEFENIKVGLSSIRKGMRTTLDRMGISEFSPEGERFDPRYHEAVQTLPDTSVREGTVVKVHLPGFILDGMLIRAAKVTVSKGGPPWDEIEELEEFEVEEDEEEKKKTGDKKKKVRKIPLGSGSDLPLVKPRAKKRKMKKLKRWK